MFPTHTWIQVTKIFYPANMQELGWLTAYQLITKETILFVHKTLYNSKPISIYELFTFSINETQNIRSIRKPMVRDYHQSQKAHRSLLYMGIYLYNKNIIDVLAPHNIHKPHLA